jgi:hypothetical protein
MMDQQMMKKGTRWLVVKSVVVMWLVTCPAPYGDKIKRKRTDRNMFLAYCMLSTATSLEIGKRMKVLR